MNEKKRKVAFYTLGCKVNIYETEAMTERMKRAGYEITDFENKADVYIVNTCSVTNMADRKSGQMLRKIRKDHPDSVIVAAGCYVQAKAKELLLSKNVDIIVGNNLKKDIVRIVDEYYQTEKNALDVEAIPQSFLLDIHKEKDFEEFGTAAKAGHTRAFLKIQDGCNQFCTYCIIPFTRGRVRSRRPGDILREVRELTEKGYKEFVLTGIHISSYGVDFKSKKDFENGLLIEKNEASEVSIPYPDFGMDYDRRDSLLAELIEEIAGIKGVERIRLSSLEPRIVSDEFLTRMARIPAFCPHFHLSLQSGCDAVLKKMNRKYTTKEYRNGVQKIREFFPTAALTTDIIVGFPGESEEEFQESLEFVREMNFAELHVFPYSRREGTKAAAFKDNLTNAQKQSRAKKMIELGLRMSKDYKSGFIGKEVQVLTEKGMADYEGRIYRIGYTREYLKVAISGENAGVNDIITGRITTDCIMDMPLIREFDIA